MRRAPIFGTDIASNGQAGTPPQVPATAVTNTNMNLQGVKPFGNYIGNLSVGYAAREMRYACSLSGERNASVPNFCLNDARWCARNGNTTI